MRYTRLIVRNIVFGLLVVVTLINGLSAQDNKFVDSLIKLLPSTTNKTKKAEVLIDLGEHYAESIKTDSSILFLDEAIDIAEQNALDTLLAEAFYTKGYAHDLAGDLSAALQYLSLIHI